MEYPVRDECVGGLRSGRPIRTGQPPLGIQARGLKRVTRLTGIAIGLDGLLRSRELLDQATVAKLGRVSRARVTQIMNLLFLAPDIQEQLLLQTGEASGRPPVLLSDLQPLAREPDWTKQRRMWESLQVQSPE